MPVIKTADLIGPALDWAVAYGLNGEPGFLEAFGVRMLGRSITKAVRMGEIKPSTDWSQGGPLIEQYNIQTSYNGNGFRRSPTGKYWCAYVCKPHGPEERPSGGGPTPLIAACRAIVAAKLGDTVQIPEELA